MLIRQSGGKLLSFVLFWSLRPANVKISSNVFEIAEESFATYEFKDSFILSTLAAALNPVDFELIEPMTILNLTQSTNQSTYYFKPNHIDLRVTEKDHKLGTPKTGYLLTFFDRSCQQWNNLSYVSIALQQFSI